MVLSSRGHELLQVLRNENPTLNRYFTESNNYEEFRDILKDHALKILSENPNAVKYYNKEINTCEGYYSITFRDYASIRILDYIDHAGRTFEDLNQRGETELSDPIKMLWDAAKGNSDDIYDDFFEDMVYLFRQLDGRLKREIPTKSQILEWMDRHPSGLDEEIIKIRKENKNRIIRIIIEKIDSGEINDKKYFFTDETDFEAKKATVEKWWNESVFHLRFAVRTPEMLNELLGGTLKPAMIERLNRAKDKGIPFFVNPYYLHLLNADSPDFAHNTDLAIKAYVFYSEELIEEFGHIVAWEKEDKVEPGKPNAAGWILPGHHTIHRRYPEVAILIPETMGRACGGLCSSCQRMYDFQSGHLNFNLNKLRPGETWLDKLRNRLSYFENDSQLRDILITGGDALMSSDNSLKQILDELYQMIKRKKEANDARPEGKKYAEMLRVRLGTRLPVYLPQRITPELCEILGDFKARASKLGVRQFVVQNHFETAMELTPEAVKGIKMLTEAGWMVTNQLVFLAQSSRRGHTAKLRKVLNDAGVLPYYTFTVKGYKENYWNFATSARSLQEKVEEKYIGYVDQKYYDDLKAMPDHPENLVNNIVKLREKAEIPFMATDRNVLNMPGVGKSSTFRVIGITRHGRRILEFEHDHSRRHSPIIKEMEKVYIIESKTMSEYIGQIRDWGEDTKEYETVWGYTLGETEKVMPIYQYPDYDYDATDEFTNLDI
ncbi:MAG: KamA family protein [Marinilabiliales bacterium]|nr:MAG: KamA family protein [Marinilabiliales bacterium]